MTQVPQEELSFLGTGIILEETPVFLQKRSNLSAP